MFIFSQFKEQFILLVVNIGVGWQNHILIIIIHPILITF